MAKSEAAHTVVATPPHSEPPSIAREAHPPAGQARSCRVLVADDHAVVRCGVRLLLQTQPGIEVLWEAANGIDAIEIVKRERPDLAVIDLTMPFMNGLEVVRDLREASPETEIVVLTMHFSDEVAREVLRCGALAYVLKSDADSDLLAAVDHVRHHQPYFTSRLQLSMAQTYVRRPGEPGEPEEQKPRESPLTPRELDVVRLLAQGKSNKEVATTLCVSTRTVESHRNHIMHKMSFPSFSDMVRFAIRTKLVEA